MSMPVSFIRNVAFTAALVAGSSAHGQGAVHPIIDAKVQIWDVLRVDADRAWLATAEPAIVELYLDTGAMSPIASGLPLSAPGRLLPGNGGPLSGDDVIISDWNSEMSAACCNGRLLRFDDVGGTFTSIHDGGVLTGVGDPFGLAWSPGGAWGDGLYGSDFQGASSDPPFLYHVADDGSATVFFQDVSVWGISDRLTDIAFPTDASYGDDLYVAVTQSGGPDGVWRVNAAGATTFFAAVPNPEGLLFADDCGGTRLYALTGSRQLHAVEPDGTTHLVATDIPSGSALSRGGLDQVSGGTLIAGFGSMASTIRLCGPDYDGDCTVGVSDLLALLANWGATEDPDRIDLTGDGTIDVADLLTFLSLWGPC